MTSRFSSLLKAGCTLVAAGWFTMAIVSEASSDPHAEFYARTPFVMAVGTGVGGSHDLNARVIGRHMVRFIPGQPTLIVRNVPGAGSLNLANTLNETSPRDGSIVAALNRAAIFDRLYTGRESRARFDPMALEWIGSPDTITAVAISWHDTPIRTVQDLIEKEFIVGSSGGTTTTVPRVLAEAAGFRFRLIQGYQSGGDVDLAIERGEVQGRAATAWSGMKSRNVDWLTEKKVNLLYQTGLSKHPELSDVPLAIDFARTEDDKVLLQLFFSAEALGYPYAAPPGTDPARLAILREAFEKTMKDPQFAVEMRNQGLDVNPVSWRDMTEIVRASYSAPEAIVDRLRSTIAAGTN